MRPRLTPSTASPISRRVRAPASGRTARNQAPITGGVVGHGRHMATSQATSSSSGRGLISGTSSMSRLACSTSATTNRITRSSSHRTRASAASSTSSSGGRPPSPSITYSVTSCRVSRVTEASMATARQAPAASSGASSLASTSVEPPARRMRHWPRTSSSGSSPTSRSASPISHGGLAAPSAPISRRSLCIAPTISRTGASESRARVG